MAEAVGRGARHFARVISESGISFARGTRIHLELDEEQFVGGGVYLFASVLERGLGRTDQFSRHGERLHGEGVPEVVEDSRTLKDVRETELRVRGA